MTCQKPHSTSSVDVLVGHKRSGQEYPQPCRAVVPGPCSFSPYFGVLSVLFLSLFLSGTNPNIPPPRQSQFGFKGNHGRNRACREQLETLEARRLAEAVVCVCMCVCVFSLQLCSSVAQFPPLSSSTQEYSALCSPKSAFYNDVGFQWPRHV